MGFIDFILNLAGLLLWLNWRSIRFDPLMKRVPATLMGTLRPAAPQRLKRWHFLVFIAALLFFRAVIYWWIGSAAGWTARLDFGPVILSCRSDWFLRILTFSFASFGLTLGIFYLCLLPLSLLNGPEPIHRLVKVPLGSVDEWPRWAKIILPFFGGAICWWLASWVFGALEILPKSVSGAERFEQSLVMGLQTYLFWKYPLVTLLLLHLLSSYIYFGKHPFWKYVAATSQTLLHPLRKVPLHIGKVDFAPVLAVAIVFGLAEGIGRLLYALYARLPL